MALTWHRRGPYRVAVVPPFTPFSALALPDAADASVAGTALESLLEELEACYDAVSLHLPPLFVDVRRATWRGWTAEPWYTYRLVPERSTPRYWSASTARNFRAGRDRYDLVDGGVTSEAVRLATESYARKGRRMPLDPGALETLAMHAERSGLAHSLGVRHRESGDLDAGVVILSLGGRAYYWVAGSRPGNAMTVLIGTMLPRLWASGVNEFDFMGANSPSVAEFKRRFGSELVPYYRLVFHRRADVNLLVALRKAAAMNHGEDDTGRRSTEVAAAMNHGEDAMRRASRAPVFLILVSLLFYYGRFGYDYANSDQDEVIPYLMHRLDPHLFTQDWFIHVQTTEFGVRTFFLEVLHVLSLVYPIWFAVLLAYVACWTLIAGWSSTR